MWQAGPQAGGMVGRELLEVSPPNLVVGKPLKTR